MNLVKMCCSAEAAWPSGSPVSGTAFQDLLQPGLWELSPFPGALADYFQKFCSVLSNLPDPVPGYPASA